MPKNTQANKASNKSKEGEQTSSGSGSGASLFNVEPSLIKNFLQNFNTFSEQWNGGLATHTHRLDELMVCFCTQTSIFFLLTYWIMDSIRIYRNMKVS